MDFHVILLHVNEIANVGCCLQMTMHKPIYSNIDNNIYLENISIGAFFPQLQVMLLFLLAIADTPSKKSVVRLMFISYCFPE